MSTKRVLTAAEVLAREEAKAKREALELALEQQLRALPAGGSCDRQFQFHPGRKWRADFALVYMGRRLIVEVQGGLYARPGHAAGRHTRGAAIEKETEKFAHALMRGWMVLPVTGKQIKSGVALQWIEKILGVQN